MNSNVPNAAEPMGPPMESGSGAAVVPEFKQLMGHPRPLWMLFMTEFWERFAFYGIRWALVLYIVAQFFGGDASGEESASRTYGAYLALVYAGAIFGGYIADRVLGHQRSILLGAVIMSAGLFMIAVPNQDLFILGLATIVVGNGMFKPNISTMVGQLYAVGDERRDSGFTLFYMGINAGAFLAPILTGVLADWIYGLEAMPVYKYMLYGSGSGAMMCLVWFWMGRRQRRGVGSPRPGTDSNAGELWAFQGSMTAMPVGFLLLSVNAAVRGWILG